MQAIPTHDESRDIASRVPAETLPDACSEQMTSMLVHRPADNNVPKSDEIVLEAGRLERLYWRDLWGYRELLYILAWRDISVRYKQTVIGIAWALIQPLLTTLVMCIVFGLVARLP